MIASVDSLQHKVQRRLMLECFRAKSYLPHKIAVCGSYTTGNIGDRAIGEAILSALSDDGHTNQLYSHRLKAPSHKYRVLGGGGVIHDRQTDAMKRRLEYVSKGGVALGIGALPPITRAGADRISEALDTAALITTRDDRSKNILTDLTETSVSVTSCPAFTLDPPQLSRSEKTGVNFRPWFEEVPTELESYFGYPDVPLSRAKKEYLNNIRNIIDDVVNPVFIPFHYSDYKFAKKNLNVPVLDYQYSVSQTLRRVASTARMICTRYHSLVFSILTSTPSFAIGYAPKVRDLCERTDIPYTYPTEQSKVTFAIGNKKDTLRQQGFKNFELFYKSCFV